MESSSFKTPRTSSYDTQDNAENATATSPPFDGRSWKTETLVFEVINLALIVITAWVLLCILVYGTKTKRWTNTAGTSSLNNGMIFTACTVAVACTLPRLIMTEITYHKSQLETGPNWCELVGDLSTGSYGLALYSVYYFLSLRQRLIYKHPYVREKVSKCMNLFSKIFFVILSVVTVALMCIFIIPKNYQSLENNCNEKRLDEFSILLACIFLATQTMMLVLCIYPAFHVSIKASDGVGHLANEAGNKSAEKNNCEAAPETLGNLTGCCRFLFSCVATSPVEMTIKKSIICSILVVLTDISAVGIETLFFPIDTPCAIRQTVVDIGSFLNIFFVLATFGFTGQVLTLFFPTCPKMERKDAAEEEQSAGTVSRSMQM